MTEITHGELFAGYGGLGLGLQAVLGGRTLWAADIESGPRKVLKGRLPDAALLGDVTKIRWTDVPPVDVMSGGSPCQDLSHAGRRLGMIPGTRSGLWTSMADAIDVLRPRLVVWENVRGAISARADSEMEWCDGCVAHHTERGGDPLPAMRALGRVLGDLADLGYDAQWYGLPASAVGAPHQRFRLFLFATPRDTDDPRLERLRHGGPAEGVPEARATRGAGADAVRPARGGVDGALLPSPTCSDMRGPGAHGEGALDLRTAVSLLPTPQAGLGEHRRDNGVDPAKRRAQGRQVSLADVARFELLPTPAVNDMGANRDPDEYDEWAARQKAADGRIAPHGRSLSVEALRHIQEWGEYGPAIERWEQVLGVPAPSPTEPGTKGQRRLSPAFAEWMMGLPAGWVTDPALGLSRKEQLKALGNGVVPQQAAAATQLYLDDLLRLQ